MEKLTLDQLYDKWVNALEAESKCMSDKERGKAEKKQSRYYNLMEDCFTYHHDFNLFLKSRMRNTFLIKK